MQNYLSIAQSVVAILLVISILLQQRGGGMGSAFGGDSGAYSTRRGIQKNFFWATIILGILFVALSLLNLFLSK